MRILWVATKSPWPPVDGGRRLLLDTLRALAAAGHDLTLVAPAGAGRRNNAESELEPFCRPILVPAHRRPLVLDALRAQLARSPLTLVRHALPAVRRRVGELLRAGDFDLVQAEQVQALSSTAPAAAPGLPVVLRAQNVESDLWAQSAREDRWRRPLLALEARRLAAREGDAVRRCAATLALTAEDAERLRRLSGEDDKVHQVPAPFPVELPPARESLPGSPPVVLFGSGGWRPNAAGADWFVRQVWPRVRAKQPQAILHAFGVRAAGDGVIHQAAPADSRAAYPRGAVLAVPLKVASGVRIKILEAWARGVPVVATPEAARGLDATGGEHLLLARDGDGFATHIRRLGRDADLARRLIDHGRRRLRERHALPVVAERLESIYESLTR